MGGSYIGQLLYYYKNLVIDTGCPHTAHEIKEFFRNKAVKAILTTHYHEDHSGGAYVFQSTCLCFEGIT